jgi:acetyl-CoA carboxylase biotin carboxyl carrier protein
LEAEHDDRQQADLGLVRKLTRLMASAELRELELEDRQLGLRVLLKRGERPAPVAPVVQMVHGAAAPAQPAASAASAAGAPAGPAAAPAAGAGRPFLSPMVGTFYRAPSPEAEPFVEVGRRVDEETVLCVIEAMKVMNEIRAELRGEIVEILVGNGEPVEFGQPLFLIKSS